MAKLQALLSVMMVVQIAHAVVSPTFVVREGECTNLPDVDWTESIKNELRNISNSITLHKILESDTILGVKISRPKLTGLGTMWAYQPYRSFCLANKTFVEVVVFAEDLLVLSVDWTPCDGLPGTLGIKVSSDKLRLIFTARPTSEDPTRLRLTKIQPDSLEDPEVFILGANQKISDKVEKLSMVLTPYTEQFWKWLLRDYGVKVIDQPPKE